MILDTNPRIAATARKRYGVDNTLAYAAFRADQSLVSGIELLGTILLILSRTHGVLGLTGWLIDLAGLGPCALMIKRARQAMRIRRQRDVES
jgi:hypothetical protein